MGLVEKTGKSAFWQILGGLLQTFIRIVASFFIARVLTPDDYGLFGLSVIVLEFINYIGAFGMNAGIIAKKNPSDLDLCTSFWTMAAIRFVLFLIGYLGASLASVVLNEPRIEPILQIISFCFLISIIDVTSETILVKRFELKKLNLITTFATLVESVLVLSLAIHTNLGFWSFVAGMIVNRCIVSVLIFSMVKWFPKFQFSTKSFKYLFKYGINGLGLSIVNYLNQNIDYLLVGRVLGSVQLGLYEFAYRVPNMIYLRMSQPVGLAAFPAFSEVSKDDDRLFSGYLMCVKYVALLTFPLLLGLVSLADIIVPALWGNQWISIVTPLRILSVCALLRCIPQPATLILYCKNRPELPFYISVAGLFFTFASVGCLGYLYGLNGVAVGMLISVFPSYLLVYFSTKIVNGIFLDIFRTLIPIILSSFFCALSAFLCKLILFSFGTNIYGILLLSVFIGAVIYILSIYLFFPILFFDCIDKTKAILSPILTE